MAEPQAFGDGRYTVVRELGRGGQKVVYLVHDRVLDRECALALIEEALGPEGVARLKHEAQSLARMGTHPNIVTVHDMGEQDGRPYVVSEYVSGGDLAAELSRAGGPLPMARALQIAQEMLRALAFIHERGIIHRDLKPSNVWISKEGVAKLGDFGLALAPDRARLTLSNTVTGTPGYVSPEQLENRQLDGRSDLYALGCLMYELLTGRPPFVGTVVSVISQHLHAAPSAPAKLNDAVPAELDAFVLSLLAKSPDDRPASAKHALERLEQSFDLKRSGPIAEPPVTMPMRPPRAKPRFPIWLATALIGVVIGGAIFMMPRSHGSQRRVVIVPTRDIGMAVNSTIAWGLASRLIEVVDRYEEFRPVSHAGMLAARLDILGRSDAVGDETCAQRIARKVGADTVAALSIAKGSDDEISVAIHIFATDDPLAAVSTERERLAMSELDADGPSRLGTRLTQALARQWGHSRLTDESGGMPDMSTPFDAYQDYLHASEFCVIGRYDQCEQITMKALARDPDNPLFHSMMTCALSYQGGREAEAEEHSRLASQHLDRLTSRLHRLHIRGNMLWTDTERLQREGDLAKVRAQAAELLAVYREMYEVHLDPWGYLYSGAVKQYFLEDFAGAREMYAIARQKGPMYFPPYEEDAKLMRGDGTSEAGNREAARLLWTFIECNPASDLVSLARLQVKQWNLPKPDELLPCPRMAGR